MRKTALTLGLVLVLSLAFAGMAMAADAPEVDPALVEQAMAKVQTELALLVANEGEVTEITTKTQEAVTQMLALGFNANEVGNLVKKALQVKTTAQAQTALQLAVQGCQNIAASVGTDATLTEQGRKKAMHQAMSELTYAVKKCAEMMVQGADPAQVTAMFQEALAAGMSPKEAAKYVKKNMKHGDGNGDEDDDEDDDEEDDDEDDEEDDKDDQESEKDGENGNGKH